MITTDFLVIGGGIIGINIARQLKERFTDATVIVIEKESHCGEHASGRNSGVLHAGFYYSPESLKAKFTRLGNKLLTEYCETKEIPINRCGKLVVTKDYSELAAREELLRREKANDIDVHAITEKEAKSIEPRVKTCPRTLFSPTTSTVNPIRVLQSMTQDAVNGGVQVHCGVQYLNKTPKGIATSAENVSSWICCQCSRLVCRRNCQRFRTV